MLVSTEGIVFNSIKYGDSSQISKVYTKKYGLLSIISSSSSKGKSKNRMYFQALSTISLTIYYKNNSTLHRLKEVNFNHQYGFPSQNMSVNAIKFFIAEVLSRLIREEEENLILYDFLINKVALLNSDKVDTSCFHIDFLFDLSALLGIMPSFDIVAKYFDLEEGEMTNIKPIHNNYLDIIECQKIQDYLNNKQQTKQERKVVLNALINYYRTQMGGLDNLKSREILEEVFS